MSVRSRDRTRRRATLLGLLAAALVLQACGSGGSGGSASVGSPSSALQASGTPAPNFSLTDQFGHPEQLSDFRGRIVLLTFIDSRCTTICPLTSQLMWQTEQDLGSTVPIQLLAINANPEFTSVSDVRTWSARHRMLHRWLFLTAPAGTLRAVWASYEIQAKVVKGDVAHTAVIFLIDAAGRIQGDVPIAQRRGIDAEALSIARAVRTVAASQA